MKRPSRWFVPYEDPELLRKAIARIQEREGPVERPEELVDPTETWRDRDFDELEKARAFAKETSGDVYERYGIEDVTPAGDPPGILWEWDERIAWEAGVEGNRGGARG